MAYTYVWSTPVDLTPVFARTQLFSNPWMVLALLLILILSLTLVMLRDRILRGFVWAVTRKPLYVLGVAAALTLASLAAVPFLTISTSRTNLMDEDNPYQQQLTAFLREFGNPNHLIAVVEGGTLDQRRQVSDKLAKAMLAEPKHFKHVMHHVDIDKIKERALLYVPLQELENLKASLERQGLMTPKMVQRFISIIDLDSMLKAMQDLVKETVAKPDPIVLKSGAQGKGIEIIEQFFKEIEFWLTQPDRKKITGLEDLYMKRFDLSKANLDPQGYMADKKYKRLYMFIRPTTDSDETKKLIPMVERARALAGQIVKKHKGVRVQFTGYPALVVDEMKIIQRDMFTTTILALVGIVCIFMLVFRVIRQAVLANSALLVGLLWTVAFTVVVYGGFNLITSLFAAILLGLGIDFGIHIIARFNEARGRGEEPKVAVESAIMGVGPGLLTGALTTATAFYTTAISEFTAFAELGVIAGTGMLFMLIAALGILPAMLVLKPGPMPKLVKEGTGRKRAATVRILLRWPIAILLVGAVITGAFSLQKEPPLDYNITSMMPEDTESKEAYIKMIEESDFKTEFIGIIVKTMADARALGKELEALKEVLKVDHIGKAVPPDQPKKLQIIDYFRKMFSGLKSRYDKLPAVNPVKLEERLDGLEETFDEVGILAKRHGRKSEAKALAKLRKQIVRVKKLLVKEGADGPAARPGAQKRVEAFQQALFTMLGKGLTMVLKMLAVKKITPKSLPPFARERYVGRSGGIAVYVYPNKSVWNRVFLGKFVKSTTKVAAKRKTAPTGFPVTFYVHIEMIKDGIISAAFLAALAIILLLLLDFTQDKYAVLALVPLAVLAVWSYQMSGWTGAAGFVLVMVGGMAMFDMKAVGYMLLAMIPLAMGAAWMIGMMSLFKIDYNLANIVAVPLLMGIGVVYCVHIIHRFRQEGEDKVFEVMRHTGGAVFLAGMTTMIGFGALSAGSHGGMKSMGQTMLIGICTCMVTALIVLPAMLRMLPKVRKAETDRVKSGQSMLKPSKSKQESEASGPDSQSTDSDTTPSEDSE